MWCLVHSNGPAVIKNHAHLHSTHRTHRTQSRKESRGGKKERDSTIKKNKNFKEKNKTKRSWRRLESFLPVRMRGRHVSRKATASQDLTNSRHRSTVEDSVPSLSLSLYEPTQGFFALLTSSGMYTTPYLYGTVCYLKYTILIFFFFFF